jgi:hypothetical protein
MSSSDSRDRTRRIDLATTLTFAAVVEVATSVAAAIAPATVVRLLLGVTMPSSALARCFGIALLALGVACWPTRQRNALQAFRAMATYNTLIAAYLAFVGAIGHVGGPLLWPAVALHAAVASCLVWSSAPLREPTHAPPPGHAARP